MSTLKNTYSSSNISKNKTFDKNFDGSSTANTVNDFTFLQKERNELSESKTILTKLTNTQLVNLTFRFQKNFDNG